ncbi:Septin-type G domain-containing protein [Meloidogyne graminicola]|uniref:Septin-type G domain-containing protein n=1 Tax=Meloidogyne graminicola TaxID=189291 RepID=A0A8T0A3T2_9BILA|nr:Septin-type G domain-containing protein [Meloidogyne graminicola]
MVSLQNNDIIGFAANFPNQIFKRCIKNGFEFSLMVVGQSGLGKSTFLNTLFMAELHDLKHDSILKQLDIDFMKQLQDRVNIVPLIAKADTLTQNELCRFRQQIMDDMRKNNISFYKFPEQFNYEQQPSVLGVTTNGKTQNQYTGGNNISFQLEKRIPFAIVGSTHVKELLVGDGEVVSKQKFRVREYPWGMVEVDNLAHNDFIALRDMIFRDNLLDLIETTKYLHYENYRMCNLSNNSFDEDSFTQIEEEILARQLEAEDTRRKQEALFNEGVAIREQRLMERALAMDKEEKENRKALEEKKALLDKLKQEIIDLKKRMTTAFNNLPELPTSTTIKPAKIPRLNSTTVPSLPIISSKGIPQQNLDIFSSFFTTKPSSKLGLVLHKAEVEGRDYQQKLISKEEQAINPPNYNIIDKFVRDQDQLAIKWQERIQEKEIREDLTRKIQARDKQLRDRKLGLEGKENQKAKKEKRESKKRGNTLATELPTIKPAKIPRLNSTTVSALPLISCKGILQNDSKNFYTFFTTKPSSKLGLVLHKAEVEGRYYQQKLITKEEQTINPPNYSIIDKLFDDQDEFDMNWQERIQEKEIREDLTRKIQARDKQLHDRKGSNKF